MYVKLFTSIYQGTLRGNSRGLLVFTNLLAHCDRDGVVDIHPRAIAEEVGLSVQDVRAALDELEAPDEESRSPDEGGRRLIRIDEHRAWGWRVVNYAKYRAIKNEDDRREANRVAVAKHRAKKAESSTVMPSNQKSSVSAQADGDGEAKAEKDKDPQTPTVSPPPPSAVDQKQKRKAQPKPSIGRPDDVAEQVWSDWLGLRRAKRAPVTQTVIDGAVREARKAGMGLEAFLAVWCRRGSQGLEADWLKPHERGGGRVPDRIDRQLEAAALMVGSRRNETHDHGDIFDAEQQRLIGG